MRGRLAAPARDSLARLRALGPRAAGVEQALAHSTRAHQRVDGRTRVRGALAPIDVLRDRFGVPHVFAQSEHALLLEPA
ncbi:MAG: hypothetical protein EXR65_03625 [Dehalococcoidia bacterium]|nr:hypothetical protein [Dehalococcoidia bacterium]